jgi:xanthine dehydrogenase accessory factor
MSVPRSRPGERPANAVRNAGENIAFSAGDEWLTPLTGHWLDAARAHLAGHAAVVRVTVVALRGSAPREPGASMLVDSRRTVGTIGGGRLEWHAIRAARELLRARDTAPVRIDDLVLGPQLGQCCGGRVELWLERLTRDDLPWLHQMARRLRTGGGSVIATEFAGGVVSHRLLRSISGAAGLELRRSEQDRVTLFETLRPQRPRLWVFGAGHVGQALVRLLSELALFEITWIDSRDELLPANLPECVTTHACAQPSELIGAARPATRYVVLTHDHGLDYELCRSILMRGDAAWLGLIGSASKSARFRSRLLRDGVGADMLAGLTCPIGIPGVASKLPAAIAIAITAQLLQKLDAAPAALSTSAPGRVARDGPQLCNAACESCGSGRPNKA